MSFKIGICLPSYNNPIGLRKLLESIQEMEMPSNIESLSVYVVINGGDISREYFKVLNSVSFKNKIISFFYELEPNLGIPFVRNRLFRMSDDCDFIAFVDDDEFVDKLWLVNYLKNLTQETSVLCGPVKGRFKNGAPKWATNYGFYDSDEHAHLKPISVFYSNNVMIKREILFEVNGPFSEDLVFTGGTDKLLAVQLKKLGHEFIWVNDSIVYEDIPAYRVSPVWLFNRKKRIGYTNTLIEQITGSYNLKSSLEKIISTLLRILLLGTLGFFSTKYRYKFIMTVGGFYGFLLFVLGVRHEEYDPKKYRTIKHD